MTESLKGRPNYRESLAQEPVSCFTLWLDSVDRLGKENIKREELTDHQLDHPLKWEDKYWFGQHQLNIQLSLLATNLLDNNDYFTDTERESLLEKIQNISWHGGLPSWNDEDVTPLSAVNKLATKQKGYLSEGEGFQFGKVGLEVSNQSQRIAFKLHSLVELMEPYASPKASSYPDQLADIMTVALTENADVFKQLAMAIGPYRYSVRWNDFLEKGGNPKLSDWIGSLDPHLTESQSIEDIRLDISWTESKKTPGTIIQLLKKNTFRSTGKVPPLRPENVADPHYHNNKVELYLPLMGPAGLKVMTVKDGRNHTVTPDANLQLDLELSELGAKMKEGVPTLIYKNREFIPEENGMYINVPLEEGKVAQWVVVRPGDIHDFTNVGISPATAYALTLGFPKEEGLSLKDDFVEAPKNTFIK